MDAGQGEMLNSRVDGRVAATASHSWKGSTDAGSGR